MNRIRFTAVALFALILACGALLQVQAQAANAKTSYPSVAPLDQYMMERNAEITMARSAAPDAISRDAQVLVLGNDGYETAVEGKNGFVCVVERAWMSPFKDTNFWNPRIRGPVCFNPPAARTVLPITYMRTKLVLAGKSKDEISGSIKAAFEKKELPLIETGAMCFMMSKQGYLSDNAIMDDGSHNMAHLMFYTPLMDKAVWGANLPKSPVYLNPQFKGAPEPLEVFMVLTGTWSDGTPAPLS